MIKGVISSLATTKTDMWYLTGQSWSVTHCESDQRVCFMRISISDRAEPKQAMFFNAREIITKSMSLVKMCSFNTPCQDLHINSFVDRH